MHYLPSIQLLIALGSAWILALGHAYAGDDLVLKARAAYDRQSEIALIEYTSQLEAERHILAPYASYWRLLLRIEDTTDADMRQFIQQYADFPFVERVRGEWIKKLGRQQDWQTIQTEFALYTRDDPAVICYGAQAQISNGGVTPELMNILKALWMKPEAIPSNCETLFASFLANGSLREDEAWARLRASLAESKLAPAKSVAQMLKVATPANLKLFERVYQIPQKILQSGAISNSTRLGRNLNLYAIDRVARNNTSSALAFLLKLKSSFNDEELAYGSGRIALHSARRHESVAAELYEQAKLTQLDEEQHAWKTRTALMSGRWDLVQAHIEAMPESQQAIHAWRYWRARALLEQGKLPDANMILAPLSKEQNYYGLLAKESLGDVISAPDVNYVPTEEEIRTAQNLPGIQRALLLYRLDMRTEARQEWQKATATFDDKQLLAAAAVSTKAEWLDNAINTTERTKEFHNLELRYPTPHLSLLNNYAKENALDEAWVYGLIRQESRFVKQAKSSVGASGLMQVMPATAKWIAKRLGMRDYRPHMIHDIDTNLQFGTHYLRYTLDQMEGQAVMATAAYNAGPSRPKKWSLASPLEGAIYTELIPLSETRDYVKKVMANAHFYAERMGKTRQTLKQRLGIVPGKVE